MKAYLIAFFLVGLRVAGAQQQSTMTPITVGTLLLNQPYITELAGPLDVYHHVPADKQKVFIIFMERRNG